MRARMQRCASSSIPAFVAPGQCTSTRHAALQLKGSFLLPSRVPQGRAAAIVPLRSFASEASREDVVARQQNLKDFVGTSNSKGRAANQSTAGGGETQGGLPVWFYIFPAITFCLGTWQVLRWREKKEMIRYRKERLLEPTTDLPSELTDEGLKEFEFRHVEVSGEFDPTREFIVRPRTRDGANGGLLITSFRRSDDKTIVLVNRGWIPAALMNDATQRHAMTDRVSGKHTKLFGLLRPGEKGGMFSPENHLADEQWYWFEIDKMRQALRLPYTPPLLDLTASPVPLAKDTYPVPQPIVTKLRDNHLNYIITWYSLTVALVATMVLKGRGQPVRR